MEKYLETYRIRCSGRSCRSYTNFESKEPVSNRIMRLLDHLSAYSFNLYYLKGKDMILTDYLSRHHSEDEDLADLIPVSFCRLRDIDNFFVGTRASLKAKGETVPKVHGVDKELDPHRQPEQQYLGKGVIPKRGSRTPRPVTKEVSNSVRDTPSNIPTDNPVEAFRVDTQRSLQPVYYSPD